MKKYFSRINGVAYHSITLKITLLPDSSKYTSEIATVSVGFSRGRYYNMLLGCNRHVEERSHISSKSLRANDRAC